MDQINFSFTSNEGIILIFLVFFLDLCFKITFILAKEKEKKNEESRRMNTRSSILKFLSSNI